MVFTIRNGKIVKGTKEHFAFPSPSQALQDSETWVKSNWKIVVGVGATVLLLLIVLVAYHMYKRRAGKQNGGYNFGRTKENFGFRFY
jgi:hypothetical protein